MADVIYDKSIGSEDRSVVATTKLWAIILGFVLLFGIGMLAVFFFGSSMRDTGRPASDNTSTRPAEP